MFLNKLLFLLFAIIPMFAWAQPDNVRPVPTEEVRIYDAGGVITADVITVKHLWMKEKSADIPQSCYDAAIGNDGKDSPCVLKDDVVRVNFDFIGFNLNFEETMRMSFKKTYAKNIVQVRIDKDGVSVGEPKTTTTTENSPLASFLFLYAPATLFILAGWYNKSSRRNLLAHYLGVLGVTAMAAGSAHYGNPFATMMWPLYGLGFIVYGMIQHRLTELLMGVVAIITTVMLMSLTYVGSTDWQNASIDEYLMFLVAASAIGYVAYELRRVVVGILHKHREKRLTAEAEE